MDEAVVLYPSPAIGHLISMVELGKLILSYRRSFSIHILIIAAPYSAGSTASYISLLPHGFLDRTKKRGLVVKSWAPQVAVLNHNSVGGFVTHCGWYSVLESVCAGVPMVAWPLYAEQRFNRIVLVEEMKIALPMNESDNGFVTASEVEKRVSELMNSEIGNSVRKRTISFKYAAEKALSEDGSSRVALSKLVESWKRE